MHAFSIRLSALLLVALALLAGCDRGYHVHPVGWRETRHYEYERDVDGLHFVTRAVGGLLGESWVIVDFAVTNPARPIRPLSMTLITAHGRFPGTLTRVPWGLPAGHDPKNAFMGANWDFSQDLTLPQILGSQASIEVVFDYGGETRTLLVNYRKE